MIRTTLLVRLILAAGLMLAWTCAGAQSLKIGFVNAAKVSAEAPQAEAARRKLEREFQPRDEELVAMQTDLEDLETRMRQDGAVMDEAERRRMERDILALKRDIRRRQEEFREDFNLRRNEELSKLQRRILDTISMVAKERGYDLVVSDGVIFASEQVDITSLIIERLRREHEAASGNGN